MRSPPRPGMRRLGRCTLVFPLTSRCSRSKRLVRAEETSPTRCGPKAASGQSKGLTRVVPNTVEGEGMEEREITDSAAVVRFYDAVRSSPLSAAALAHGEASSGRSAC